MNPFLNPNPPITPADPNPEPGSFPAPRRFRRPRLSRRTWAVTGAVAVVLVLATSARQLCAAAPHFRLKRSATRPEELSRAGTPAPPAFEVVFPIRTTVRSVIEQPGRIEGYEQAAVFVKIPGYVREWKADIGQRVGFGDVLAELAVPEEVEELKRREATVTLAAAEVTAAETALDTTKADEERASALLVQAHAAKGRAGANVTRWTAEFKRAKETRAAGVGSESDYDLAQYQLTASEAALKEVDAEIAAATATKAVAAAARVKASAGVMVARAKVTVAQADLRRQTAWLSYATVRAPFSGVISRRNVDRGQYVTPPTSGVAQPPLFAVVRTDPVRVLVDVPEAEAALVASGLRVAVRVQALGDREFTGTVARSSWALDQTTRTLRLEIDLPNPLGELRPGMFATVQMKVERPGAWVLPTGAVVTADEQPYAIRLEGERTVRTPVKLGARQGGAVEVIQKQTRPTVRGEPTPWEPLTGTETFLTSRPVGWTDGMSITAPPLVDRQGP